MLPTRQGPLDVLELLFCDDRCFHRILGLARGKARRPTVFGQAFPMRQSQKETRN